MQNQLAKFEVGKVYTMGFAGDSDLKPEFKLIKMTAKTATFEAIRDKETFTKKLKVSEGYSEYVRVGSYSMAPSIYAKDLVKPKVELPKVEAQKIAQPEMYISYSKNQ
jgi:hypothetical protein